MRDLAVILPIENLKLYRHFGIVSGIEVWGLMLAKPLRYCVILASFSYVS